MSNATSPAPITTAAEAERAIAALKDVIDRLEETLVEETARVRAGRLRDALQLEERKGELARRYTSENARLIAARQIITQALPEALDALRQRHESFRANLRTNLTVLATSHAVAEGIIRGVSGELARKQAPSTYSASGRANAPSPRASQPLALSRTL